MNNRKIDKRSHPTYVYARVGENFKYLGITHAKITDGIKNIPLEKNPNPKDKRSAYVRPHTQQANRSKFGKGLNSWKFSDKDKAKIKTLIDNDKH